MSAGRWGERRTASRVASRLGLYLALARRRDLDAYDLLGDLDYTTVTIDKRAARARLRFESTKDHGSHAGAFVATAAFRPLRTDPA